jgi:CHAT domain-containing protein/tetratricopeptide (TPR) repeat protein
MAVVVSCSTDFESLVKDLDRPGIEKALKGGLDPNSIESADTHATMLYRLVQTLDYETADILLKYGADVNKQNRIDIPWGYGGETPVFAAIANGHLYYVKKLVDRGAVLRSTETVHLPASPVTRIGGNDFLNAKSFCDYFAEKGIDFTTDPDGYRELLAKCLGDVLSQDFIMYLVNNGVRIEKNAVSRHLLMASKTPEKIDIKTVELLLRNGADPNLREPRNGWSPLDLAATENRSDIAYLLVQYGADVRSKGKDGKFFYAYAKPGLAASFKAVADDAFKIPRKSAVPVAEANERLARARFDAAAADYKAKRYADAERGFLASSSLYAQAGNGENAGVAYYQAGLAQREIRRYDAAAESMKRALQYAQSVGNSSNQIIILFSMGETLVLAGRFSDAADCFEKEAALLTKPSDEGKLLKALFTASGLFMQTARYDRAVPHLEKCAELFRKNKLADQELEALNLLSICYREWGDSVREKVYLNRALKLANEINPSAKHIPVYLHAASVESKEKRFGQALPYLRKAGDVAEKLKDDSLKIRVMKDYAAYLGDTGDMPGAAEVYTKIIALCESRGDKAEAAMAYNNLGSFWLLRKEYDKGLAYLSKGYQIVKTLGVDVRSAEALGMIGYAHMLKGQYAEASKNFQEITGLYDKIRVTASGETRREYLAKQIAAYYLLVSALIRDNKAADAFSAAESSHAKYLVDRIGDKAGKTASSGFRISDFRKNLPSDSAVLDFTLYSEDYAYTDAGKGNGLARFYADRREFDGRELSTVEFASNMKKITGTKALSATAGLRGFSVKASEFSSSRKNELTIEKFIMYYRKLLSSSGSKAEAREIGRSLYDFLFNGLESRLDGKKRLIIIPGGVLAMVPFESLVLPDGRYLVEKYDVSYAQSLAVLDGVSKREYRQDRKPLLALGGAVYGPGKAEASVLSDSQLAELRQSAGSALAAGKDISGYYEALGYSGWASLPGTLAEVKSLGGIVKGSDVLTGTDASEESVKKLTVNGQLKNYRVLHFATHGLAVPEAPDLSAIVLSRGGSGSSDDGYLTMKEIERLDISADFVCLSACETGLGKIYGGEGVVGLTQAFMAAGAKGLSVSLWQVADASTKEYMEGLYELAQSKGLGYCEAMSEMKRRFIRSGRYADPFYWAPFVAYGSL